MTHHDPFRPRPVLVTDLDDSLIATDLLHESFWSATAADWSVPVRAAASLRKGRAALKADLGARAQIDVTTLPYSPDVLAILREWRAAGGRTVLATAADQRLAEDVAAHLDLFDEVHGSHAGRNLKGEAKADLLVTLYGEAGFDYIGDSRADLSVWRHARRAITVGAAPELKTEVEKLRITEPALHLPAPAERGPQAIWRAMRPHQWLKNLLVFLPMLAAHDLSLSTLLMSVLAFIAFSMTASSVYLLNDLLDLSSDRAHPRKCHRPLASGRLPILTGGLLAPTLLLGGLTLALVAGPLFLAVLGVYYAVTLAYSLELKRRAIVDVTTLSVLYTLRVVAGGAAAGISISVWLLAFSLFFFFSLAIVKRQAELVDAQKTGRNAIAGRGYRLEDLPIISMMAVGSGLVSVLVMALYVTSEQVTLHYSQPAMLWGICLLLLYWNCRIALITHRGEMNDDPVVFAVHDRNSQVCGAMALLFATLGALL